MLEMMIKTMFATVNMMLITTVEISQKPNVQSKLQFWKVLKHCKPHIHCVHIVGNDYLNYFTIVSMMRTTGVEIS